MAERAGFCYIVRMTNREIMSVLRTNRDALRAVGVEHAYLFGSVARGDDKPGSDIDVMIDVTHEPFSLLDLVGVQQKLEDILQRSVDVVIRTDALKGNNLKNAASQAVNVF